MEPPMSVPVAIGANPAATAAPDPPDEPPVPYSGLNGLTVLPQARVRHTPDMQNSDVAVRARMIAPASWRRSTIGSDIPSGAASM